MKAKKLLATLGVVAGVAFSVHAEPLARLKIQDAVFMQDDTTSRWTVKWRKFVMETPYTFDSITLHKTIVDKSGKGFIALISGSEGRMCEQNFRVLFFTPDSNIQEFADFKTCYANKIEMSASGNVLNVTLDKEKTAISLAPFQQAQGMTQQVPAKPQQKAASARSKPTLDQQCYDNFMRQASAMGVVDDEDKAKIIKMCMK